ncbi:MAG: MFS transporter [Haloarculaceae archaeon]
MTRRERERWWLLLSLVALSALSNAYIIVPASVLPVVMRELAIGATAAGWVVSAVFAAQIVASVPTGLALDRFGGRAAVVLATAALVTAGLWGAASAASGAYLSLVVSRLLGGAASIVIWNAGVTVIGGAFDGGRRATAVGAFTAASPAGFALGHLSGPLVARVDWTATFAVYGLLAVVPLVAFWFLSPAGSRRADAAGTRAGAADPRSGAVGRVLRDRSVVVLCATTFAVMSVYVLLNSWTPTYLAEELGASLATGGLVVAVLPAMGVLSRTGGGAISDRLFDGRRRPVVALSFLVPLPLLATLAGLSTVAAALAVLVLAGFFVQLAVGVLFTAAGELVDPPVVGTAVATVTAAGAVGSFTAPLVAGALIDATGSFDAAFGYGIAVGFGGLVLSYLLPEPRDS